MREATVRRKTKETEIEALLNLEGDGRSDIQTGIGFFDHMLDLFAFHPPLPLFSAFPWLISMGVKSPRVLTTTQSAMQSPNFHISTSPQPTSIVTASSRWAKIRHEIGRAHV